ncbi:MAG: hypothetical protein HPY53_11240 [Brevinematales bacterium]|nr:hypothetical protein [Brevinematales bacterium]
MATTKVDKGKISGIGLRKPAAAAIVPAAGSTEVSQLNHRFYNVRSGAPISLDELKVRISGNFQRRDKLAAETLIDLFFISANKSYYGLEGQFEQWIQDNFTVHRTTVYRMIKVVDVLMEYSEGKFNNALTGNLDQTLEFIENAVNTVGMTKLISISQVVEEKRDEMIEHVMAGEIKTADEIDKLNKEYKKEMAAGKEKPLKVEATAEVIPDEEEAVDQRVMFKKAKGKFEVIVYQNGELWADNSLLLTVDPQLKNDVIHSVTENIISELEKNSGKVFKE